jgi:hypothetical protein
VKVTLASATIRDGDRVTVLGKEQNGKLLAETIAIGEAADDIPSEPQPRPKSAAGSFTLVIVCALVAAGFGFAAKNVWPAPCALDFSAIGAMVFAFAVHRVARSALVFRSAKGRVDPRPFGAAFHVSVGGAFVLMSALFTLGDLPGHLYEGRQQNASPFVLGMSAIYLLLLLVDSIRSNRGSLRLARVVLAAPPLQGERWGAVTGEVRAHQTKPAIYALLEEEWREGSGSNPRTEQQAQGPFLVADGERRVRVEPNTMACWATDAVQTSSASARPDQKVIVERSEIRDGARVIAVGRGHAAAKDTEVLAASGPESLVIFASTGNPRASLRARAALVAFTIFFVFGAMAACVAGAVLQPDMPAVNIPESN